MSLGLALVAVLIVALAAGWLGYARARRLRARRPAAFAAGLSRRLCCAVGGDPGAADPRRVGAGAVANGRPGRAASPEGRALPAFEMQRESILSEAREIASGEREQGFNPQSSTLAPRIRAEASALRADRRRGRDPGRAGRRRCSRCAASAPQFRARTGVERWVMIVLFAASLIAILTTLGILLSLMFESLRFFRLYPVDSFLFGTRMEPADGDPRRPGRLVGGVRLDPAAVGHVLHRRDHRHDRRRPARA